MMTSTRWLLAAAICFCTSSPQQQNTVVTVRIEKTTPDKQGIGLTIEIGNEGSRTVFLEESAQGNRIPTVVNIEGRSRTQGWKFVGPFRDTTAVSVFALKPGENVKKQVTYYSERFRRSGPLRDTTEGPPITELRITVRYFLKAEDWQSLVQRPAARNYETASSESIQISADSR
ncbi:MAG: hypothetical protein WCB14_04310 [Candidatus Acidiferrales bacterium]